MTAFPEIFLGSGCQLHNPPSLKILAISFWFELYDILCCAWYLLHHISCNCSEHISMISLALCLISLTLSLHYISCSKHISMISLALCLISLTLSLISLASSLMCLAFSLISFVLSLITFVESLIFLALSLTSLLWV